MPPIEMPYLIILGGPNGAGKSTAAATLLPPDLTFVNADEVAKTLPDYPSPSADREAGRLVIQQLETLASSRTSFATETTLAGRSLATRAAKLRVLGYRLELIFLWSPSAEFLRPSRRVSGPIRRPSHPRRRDPPPSDLGAPEFLRTVSANRRRLGCLRCDQFGQTPTDRQRYNRKGDVRVDNPETWQLMREDASDEL